MKRVLLGNVTVKDGDDIKLRAYFINQLQHVPEQDGQGRPVPMTTAVMRPRFKILDKLEALDDEAPHVDLEDAEHQVLCAVLASAGFGKTSREVVKIEDDVKAAKSPPKRESK